MSLTGLLTAVILVGAIHGLIIAAMLWQTKRGRPEANRWLAAIIALMSLNMLDALFIYTRLYMRWPHLLEVIDPTVLLLGPMAYFYARVVLELPVPRWPVQLLHAIPAACVFAAFTPFYLQPGEVKAATIAPLLYDPPTWLQLLNGMRFLQSGSYLLAIGVLVYRHTHLTGASRRGTRRWLGFFAVIGMAAWVTSLITVAVGLSPISESLVQFVVAVLLFTVGYTGMFAPDLLYAVPAPDPRKYSRSPLDEEASRRMFEQLLTIMREKKPYRSPDLDLQQLAALTGLQPHHLSQIINERAGLNYYRFVNGFRVEEATRLLSDPETSGLKLIAIAEESGFNSLATFNRVFKDAIGCSPSAYRSRPR
jgi:AraC-like DNA-binding protein